MGKQILLILKACEFAADKHRNQRRKDHARTPYINHPLAVARVLADEGGVKDAEILAAAILHDTLEDHRPRSRSCVRRLGGVLLHSLPRSRTTKRYRSRCASSVKSITDRARVKALR